MKLTYAQQQAVDQIRRNGSLVRESMMRGWRHSQNGFMPLFSTTTVSALAKKGVLKIDRLIDGRDTATLVEPNTDCKANPNPPTP